MFTFASIVVKLNQVYLSLGSNVGNRSEQLSKAIDFLKEKGEVKRISSVYETEAWGNINQPSFLNLVLQMMTNFKSIYFMKELLLIEEKMGRIRQNKWESRIIDIDILYFNNEIIDENELKIPHPYIHERKFVLEPLAEIAPDFVHPLLKLSSIEMLKACSDSLKVKRLSHV